MRSSTPGPRRRLPAAERRELIERAAMDLFARHGYHGTAVDEIARRAGVTPPVVYDHFRSKAQLHEVLLIRTRDELLAMWRDNLGGEGGLEAQVQRAFTAWATYVRAHPYATRVFFRETTGVPEIRAAHAEISAAANGALVALLGGLLSGRPLPPEALAMAAEVVRGGLTELAIWWADHPETAREAIVAAAMNTVWVGLDRVSRGDVWRADAGADPPRG